MAIKDTLKSAAKIGGLMLGVAAVGGGLMYSALWAGNQALGRADIADKNNYYLSKGDLAWGIDATSILAETDNDSIKSKVSVTVLKYSLFSESVRYEDYGETVEDLDGKVDRILTFRTDGTYSYEHRISEEYPNYNFRFKEEKFKEADRIFAEEKKRFQPVLDELIEKLEN